MRDEVVKPVPAAILALDAVVCVQADIVRAAPSTTTAGPPVYLTVQPLALPR